MDDFLATKSIGNGRNLHIASLARHTIEDCGAAHLGYEGYFVFETSDLPDRSGITIFGKTASYEAAIALADIIAAYGTGSIISPVHYDDAATALAEAQAEIARLKDVLEIVAAGPILGEPMARWINHMMVKARAALARPHDAAEGEAG